MADITVTIPDPQVQRVIDALCGFGGWTAETGLTKAQFAKAQVAEHLKRTVKNWEEQEAQRTAVLAVETPPDIT